MADIKEAIGGNTQKAFNQAISESMVGRMSLTQIEVSIFGSFG